MKIRMLRDISVSGMIKYHARKIYQRKSLHVYLDRVFDKHFLFPENSIEIIEY